MQDHRTPLTTAERAQRVRLELILSEYPALLALRDLAMEIEDVSSAVRELTTVGYCAGTATASFRPGPRSALMGSGGKSALECELEAS